MSFRSPWRWRWFTTLVAGVRLLLRPFGDREPRFIRKLVALQNRRVVKHLQSRPVSSVLLIVPRCLKRTDCRVDVRARTGRTVSIPQARPGLRECRDCDECPLGGIAQLTHQHGVHALVAYRSHIAYELARREQPDLIIAAACEDRLVKAIRSVPEIPALLTPLTGMQKPCAGASFDLDWLADQLRLACGPVPAERQEPPSANSSVDQPRELRSLEG